MCRFEEQRESDLFLRVTLRGAVRRELGGRHRELGSVTLRLHDERLNLFFESLSREPQSLINKVFIHTS
jgi:hypothetical protein